MPHSDTHWRTMITTLEKAVNHERASAGEWKVVADQRLDYLHALDSALGRILTRANRIQKIFDVKAPAIPSELLSNGASGEETARSCRDKLLAMVHFTENLAIEARSVESTLQDVFCLAHEALASNRPDSDLAPSTLAGDIKSSFETTTKYYDVNSPVTSHFDPSLAEETSPGDQEEDDDADSNEAETPKPNEPEDIFALMRIK